MYQATSGSSLGSDSGSAKTQLLYLLAALQVLPVSNGGKESTVVWLDTDGRFSALRLYHVICSQLQLQQQTEQQEQIRTHEQDRSSLDHIARSALCHVHVFHIQSSSQLQATLDPSSLQSYLLDTRRHHSAHRLLGLLVLDSASALYWVDRFESEMARVEGQGRRATLEAEHSQLPAPSPSATTIISQLKQMQGFFECAIVFTARTTSSSSRPSTGPHTTLSPERHQQQPDQAVTVSPWRVFATFSLNVSRVPISQFPAQMALNECLRDSQQRLTAVREGKVLVSLDTSATLVPKYARERMRTSGTSTNGFMITVNANGVSLAE